jgi:hypothetical protein
MGLINIIVALLTGSLLIVGSEMQPERRASTSASFTGFIIFTKYDWMDFSFITLYLDSTRVLERNQEKNYKDGVALISNTTIIAIRNCYSLCYEPLNEV